MANQIILKKSSVAAKAPVAADLEYGELALNYSDGKLYYKKADNSIDAFTAGAKNSSGSSSYAGNYVLSAETSTAQTTARLRTNTAPADSTNQIILPNNSAYAFTGIVVARQQSSVGTQTAAWLIKGLIRKEGTTGSTVLVTSILEVIKYPSSTWTISIVADTTNGGLAIDVTSPSSAGNIRWVATVQTAEVIYA